MSSPTILKIEGIIDSDCDNTISDLMSWHIQCNYLSQIDLSQKICRMMLTKCIEPVAISYMFIAAIGIELQLSSIAAQLSYYNQYMILQLVYDAFGHVIVRIQSVCGSQAGVIGMCVSRVKCFLHMHPQGCMFPHTHITRDACFPSVIHVSPAHISLGIHVSCITVQHLQYS